jgi:hypothetical protein
MDAGNQLEQTQSQCSASKFRKATIAQLNG